MKNQNDAYFPLHAKNDFRMRRRGGVENHVETVEKPRIRFDAVPVRVEKEAEPVSVTDDVADEVIQVPDTQAVQPAETPSSAPVTKVSEKTTVRDFLRGLGRDGLQKPMETTSLSFYKDASDGSRCFGVTVPDDIEQPVPVKMPAGGAAAGPGDVILFDPVIDAYRNASSAGHIGVGPGRRPAGVVPKADVPGRLTEIDKREAAAAFAKNFEDFAAYQDFLRDVCKHPEGHAWQDVVRDGHPGTVKALVVPDGMRKPADPLRGEVLSLANTMVPDVVLAEAGKNRRIKPPLWNPHDPDGNFGHGLSMDEFRASCRPVQAVMGAQEQPVEQVAVQEPAASSGAAINTVKRIASDMDERQQDGPDDQLA